MILIEIVELIKSNIQFKEGIEYDNILEKYSCLFKKIDNEKYVKLFGKSEGYYKGSKYSVMQFFYPDKLGHFPWEDNYSLEVQEVL